MQSDKCDVTLPRATIGMRRERLWSDTLAVLKGGIATLQNRFLVVFGGGSVANCYNDVVMLDTKTLEWSSPQTTGAPPTPRAGGRACHGTLMLLERSTAAHPFTFWDSQQ